jgi:hypothetical protein
MAALVVAGTLRLAWAEPDAALPGMAFAAATELPPPPTPKPRGDSFLFGNGPVDKGIFGAPVIKLSSLRGNAETFIGGRGGFVINHSLVLGAAYYGMVGTQGYMLSTGDRRNLDFGYGGAELEYIWRPSQRLHASALLLLGAGGIHSEGPGDHFFIAEPTIHVDLAVSPWLRLSAGGGYRIATSVDLEEVDNSDVGGAVGVFTFKFGQF